MKKLSNTRMMVRLGLICTMLMVLFIASCKTSKAPVQQVTDSVFVVKTVLVRDTVFVTPSASTAISIPLNSIKTGLKAPLNSESKQAKLNISQEGDNINVQCDCDTLALKAKIRDSLEKQYRQKTIIPEPEKIKYIPGYIKVLSWVGAISLLLVLIVFVYWIAKRRKL